MAWIGLMISKVTKTYKYPLTIPLRRQSCDKLFSTEELDTFKKLGIRINMLAKFFVVLVCWRSLIVSASNATFSDIKTLYCYSSSGKLLKDLYRGGYLIENANLCPNLGKNMTLLILIPSALKNEVNRTAIRHTWGFYGRHHNIGVGFVLGSFQESSQDAIIQKEQDTYGDLIQNHMVDSWDNLPLKTVSLLEWVNTYCPHVPFVLKTDDDAFINIPRLLKQLDKQKDANRSMFGQLRHAVEPDRGKHQRFYVSEIEFEPKTYPDYMRGAAYMMTQDSVHDLYQEALEMPYIKIVEDIFMGIAASRIGLQLIDLSEFSTKECPSNINEARKVIIIHPIANYCKHFSYFTSMMYPKDC